MISVKNTTHMMFDVGSTKKKNNCGLRKFFKIFEKNVDLENFFKFLKIFFENLGELEKF